MAQEKSQNCNYFEQAQQAFQAAWQNATNAPQNADWTKAASAYQAIAQKTAESVAAAGKAIFDSAQSIAKSQADFFQKQAEQVSAAASKAMNAGKPEENIETAAKLAQKSMDANLKNGQDVAKSASEAAVQAFDILNKQAVKNLNELTDLAKAS